MLKKLSLILIFTVLFVGCGANTPSTDSQETQGTEDSQESENNKPEESEIKQIPFSQWGDSSPWSIQISESYETDSVQGNNDTVRASGKFVVIKAQFKNISKSKADYSSLDFSLIDIETEKVYSIDDTGRSASQALNVKETIYNDNQAFFGTYDSINPDIEKTTYLVFDISKDANLDNLVLVHNTDDTDETSPIVTFSLK